MNRTIQPKKRQLETNIALIRKIAWSFHNSIGEDWDDLFQEAALAYCEALKTYNPKKGKITTYMWWCITSHLKNYIKLEEKRNGHICSQEEMPATPTPASSFDYESLSEDAQQVAKAVIRDSRKYLSDTPQGARRKIAQNIFQENSWSWNRVRTAIQDLRLAYS